MFQLKLLDTHLGNIAATSLSVFCLSTSNSSVLSLIRSSKLDEYCSNIRSIESIMLVFFPLVMLLNCQHEKDETQMASPACYFNIKGEEDLDISGFFSIFTCLKISSKDGLLSGSSLQACFTTCITSSGASSTDKIGRHNGGGSLTLLIISVLTHKQQQIHTDKTAQTLGTHRNAQKQMLSRKCNCFNCFERAIVSNIYGGHW